MDYWMLVAYGIFAVLAAVSTLHIGWAFGMAWPAKTRAGLSAMVVGTPEGSPMPPVWLTLAVAAGILALGVAALWGAGVVTGLAAYRPWAMGAIAAVFALRGAATYLPIGPLQASVQPFRRLDRRYFAPLCLLLAAGYLALYIAL